MVYKICLLISQDLGKLQPQKKKDVNYVIKWKSKGLYGF